MPATFPTATFPATRLGLRSVVEGSEIPLRGASHHASATLLAEVPATFPAATFPATRLGLRSIVERSEIPVSVYLGTMGRPRRFIPPRSLVEVTCRTVHGRFLLRPSRDLNEIAIGIIARAARRYRVQVVAFVILSNHAHYLLVPDDANQLAGFMNYVNGNLAREAGRLHGWRERFWGRRYRAIVISNESEAQIGRLRYLLSQGCKEGLVRSPEDWPGASAIAALLTGERLTGVWFDRTAECKARGRRSSGKRRDYASEENLELAPLPAWQHEQAVRVRELVAELVRGIEQEVERRFDSGRLPVGRRRILRRHPHSIPEESLASTAAPQFLAVSRAARDRLKAAYAVFCQACRHATIELRAGDRTAYDRFPEGSFPPGLPFRCHRNLEFEAG